MKTRSQPLRPAAVSGPLLAALGRLVLSSAALDQTLVDLTADLLHCGRAQYVFADQLSSYVDPILRRLATDVLPPPMLQRLEAILEDVGQLHDLRHRMVRGLLTTQEIQAPRALSWS